jgi:hypothetical protein
VRSCDHLVREMTITHSCVSSTVRRVRLLLPEPIRMGPRNVYYSVPTYLRVPSQARRVAVVPKDAKGSGTATVGAGVLHSSLQLGRVIASQVVYQYHM